MFDNNITLRFLQKTFNFLFPKDLDIISGVIINGIFLEGSDKQEDAIGSNDHFREKVFALLGVAYQNSDLDVVIGNQVEDDLDDQFVRYQK